jgi:hypothetical protein
MNRRERELEKEAQRQADFYSRDEGPRDPTCRFCCRVLKWYRNPKETNPNMRQAVCCGMVYYREERP